MAPERAEERKGQKGWPERGAILYNSPFVASLWPGVSLQSLIHARVKAAASILSYFILLIDS